MEKKRIYFISIKTLLQWQNETGENKTILSANHICKFNTPRFELNILGLTKQD